MKPIHAFVVAALVAGSQSVAWGQTSKSSVIVGNTSSNPVPVVTQGTTSVSGSVSVTNVPNVKVINTTASPVPVSGPVEVFGQVDVSSPVEVFGTVSVSGPGDLSKTYGVRGATSGSHSYPVQPAVGASMLVLSSRNRILVGVGGGAVSLEFEVFPNQTVVIPFPQTLYVDHITTNCTDPGELCEYFTVNVVGTAP